MDELGDSYTDWKSWDPKDFGRFDASEAVYFAAETSLSVGTTARVLEIGFGNGSFLGWVRSIGGEIFGIEANPGLKERARAFIGVACVFDDLADPAIAPLRGTLTHIVAFDVIEHIAIERLPVLLTLARDLLREDGRLILRFPNGDSPFGRITQHGDPTHVTTLGRQKIEFLARGSGLRIEEIRAPRLPVRGITWQQSLKRRTLKVLRSVVEFGVSQLYFGGRRIPLDPNYVAVLRLAGGRGPAEPERR